MLFSRDDKAEKTKRRSVLGIMFNPEIGESVRPVGESLRVFVQLIAMVFITGGLFPKNHPAFREVQPAPLTLREVIMTAWSNVSFTREKLPQTILFFAVVGTLAFGVFLVILMATSLFISPAHAQMFTVSDEASDWGLGWINYIFRGETLTAPGDSTGLGGALSCWQGGLSKALGYYSSGVLVLGGVLLLYHLVSMVVETAHTGKPMGRANQIWAPIRLVVAIGLLVPIGAGASSSGCTVSGLNVGQHIVIHMAKWGSALASNAWNVFTTQISTSTDAASFTSCGDSGAQSPSCIGSLPAAQLFAKEMIRNLVCKQLYNKKAEGMGSTLSYNSKTHTIGSTTWFGGKALCGGYTPNDNLKLASNPYNGVYTAQAEVVEEFIKDGGVFDTVAKSYVDNNYAFLEGTAAEQPSNKGVDDAATEFQEAIMAAIKKSIASADAKAVAEDSSSNAVYKTGGWLSAGVWINALASREAARMDAVYNGLPGIVKPDLEKYKDLKAKNSEGEKNWGGVSSWGNSFRSTGVAEYETLADLERYNEWAELEGTNTANMEKAAKASETVPSGSVGFGSRVFNAILWGIDKAAGLTNVWSSEGTLAVKFDTSRNPFSEVAAFGQRVIGTGSNLLGWGFMTYMGSVAAKGIGLLGGTIGLVGGNIGALAEIVGTFLLMIGAIIIGAGILLAYFLPLVPFLRFFFASLTWIIGVAEAVVAAPLLALAHINPEGDGLPGQRAQAGYYLITNLFLRPILMLFGLITGFILFNIGISFLNALFVYAAQGTGTFTQLPVMSRLIFTVTYCALAYVLGNNSFKSIGMFPQFALKWLGAGEGHLERMGDHATVVKALTGMGAYIAGKEMIEFMKTPGGIMSGVAGSVKGYKDEQAANKLSDWRGEMLKATRGGSGGAGTEPQQLPPDKGGGGGSGSDPNMPKRDEPEPEDGGRRGPQINKGTETSATDNKKQLPLDGKGAADKKGLAKPPTGGEGGTTSTAATAAAGVPTP